VATWDGNICKVYVDEDVTDKISKSGYEAYPISQLKYDLDDHFEKGGKLLGHNIASFDLPVLKDSLDIYCIGKYLGEKRYIDTSRELTKQFGERFRLQNLVDNTLGESKSLKSEDAPKLWKAGEYDTVVDYCIKDTKLVYDLWKSGQEKPLKAFSIEKEEMIEMEVDW
tara:strand:- start:347 stop:850 length:504 start_codon:yes stop_codon:yes gene_type:complete